jgi:hypothetical protein
MGCGARGLTVVAVHCRMVYGRRRPATVVSYHSGHSTLSLLHPPSKESGRPLDVVMLIGS